MSTRCTYVLLAAACALGFGLQPAGARTLTVGTCNNANPYFTTVQSAVDAAFSGDTVVICPGSYGEQVVVPRSMTLKNVKGFASPTIAVPNGGVVQNTMTLGGFPTAAQILVASSSPINVNIKNLIVDGTGNNDMSCGLELMGIYYQNAGGTISGNTVENQMLPVGYQGCQDGEGIFVESATAGTGLVTITKNAVTNFDKNGITVGLAAADADIFGNVVTGIGPTPLIAQNGIQVGYGATADISGNNVSNLIYTGGTYGSSGILLYDLQAGTYLGPSTVQHNRVTSAQYGVVLDAVNGVSGTLVQVASNSVSNAQFAGVGLYSDFINNAPASDDYVNVVANIIGNTSPYDGIDACSNNNTINNNKVNNSNTEAAIHLDGLCSSLYGSQTGIGNSVSGNRIDVACVGILSGPPQGANTIGTNHFLAVMHQIIYNQDTYSCGTHARGTGAVATTPPRHLAPSRI